MMKINIIDKDILEKIHPIIKQRIYRKDPDESVSSSLTLIENHIGIDKLREVYEEVEFINLGYYVLLNKIRGKQ